MNTELWLARVGAISFTSLPPSPYPLLPLPTYPVPPSPPLRRLPPPPQAMWTGWSPFRAR